MAKKFLVSPGQLENDEVSLPVVAESTEAAAEPAMQVGGFLFNRHIQVGG
ncbi:MAG: hypothetical protein NTZ94_01675 [Verrucomicrobia bacterium]|nr:hypothetical protein [Verrucomicrobiota bacterium]